MELLIESSHDKFCPTNLGTRYMASRCLSFRHPSWVWAEKTGNCPWPPKKVCHFVVQILFWVWEISVLLLIEIDIRNLHRHKILCLNLMLITSGVSLCCPKKYASCLKTTTLNVSKPLKMAAIIMNVSSIVLKTNHPWPLFFLEIETPWKRSFQKNGCTES